MLSYFDNRVTTGSFAAILATGAVSGIAYADNFSGAYAGASFELPLAGGDTPYLNIDPNQFIGGIGAFVGYNYNFGNFVLGGELSYSTARVGYDFGFEEDYLYDFVDIKLRAGAVSGDTLFYGLVSQSFASAFYDDGFDADIGNGSGIGFGIGVEYQLSDRFSLGAEVLQRNLDGLIDGDAFSTSTTSASIRGVISF